MASWNIFFVDLFRKQTKNVFWNQKGNSINTQAENATSTNKHQVEVILK